MDQSAKALESFCEGDEVWVDSWTVNAVGRGWSPTMSRSSADETIGLTDERLLWLDESLETIERADIEGVSADVIEHRSAPLLVRAGGGALALGVMGSAVLSFVLSVPLTTGLLPLAVGILTFVGVIGFSRATKQSGKQLVHHRLRIDTEKSVVTVWADQKDVEALADALDPATDR